MFAKAIKKMANSEDITGILGNIGTFSSIQSGFVRAYKLDGGDWGLGPGTRGFAIPTFLGEDKNLCLILDDKIGASFLISVPTKRHESESSIPLIVELKM